ncbi:vesicle transport protein GOT1A isoform X1 [Anas acuta]|uniref:vesicle transport protein GOT1A isoform X1 n=1 Tax=Anas acuta TaxID=28680 RepID=UPI0035C8FFAC
MVTLNDFQRISLGLVGFGVFFILFGMLLYFDSVLLAFGNILFLSGLVFIIGFRRTFTFFFQRQKLKGTSFFLGGVLIVLMRWPILGMLLEAYGFVSLFRSFFPGGFRVFGLAGKYPHPEQALAEAGRKQLHGVTAGWIQPWELLPRGLELAPLQGRCLGGCTRQAW